MKGLGKNIKMAILSLFRAQEIIFYDL